MLVIFSLLGIFLAILKYFFMVREFNSWESNDEDSEKKFNKYTEKASIALSVIYAITAPFLLFMGNPFLGGYFLLMAFYFTHPVFYNGKQVRRYVIFWSIVSVLPFILILL